MIGFYMGFDASNYPLNEVRSLAQKLMSSGLYEAGYRMIRLGQRNCEETDLLLGLCRELHALDFEIDLTLCQENIDLANKVGTAMVTFLADDQERVALASQAARDAGVNRICIKTDKEEDLEWAAKIADVVELSIIANDDDFYTITRDRMDSCRDGDTDTELSTANLRRKMLLPGKRYQLGSLPLRFDDERNFAILCAYAVLGCPLVIASDIDDLSPATLAALKCNKIVHVAEQGVGGVVRYYDPWHVLFGKMKDEKSGYMLILNRCHGDKPSDILTQDFGWNTSIELFNVRTGEMVAQKVHRFDAYVESSDYPRNPCCMLLFGQQNLTKRFY